MKGALLAGEALANHTRVLVDENLGGGGHGAGADGRGGRGKHALEHACASGRRRVGEGGGEERASIETKVMSL